MDLGKIHNMCGGYKLDKRFFENFIRGRRNEVIYNICGSTYFFAGDISCIRVESNYVL